MLDAIQTFLRGFSLSRAGDEPDGEHSLRLAVALLLLDVARADMEVSAEELTVLSGMAHVLALPSQDLLAQLLGSAIGPEQQWQSLSSTGRYAVSKTG